MPKYRTLFMLFINNASLEKMSSGNIFGEIYFQLNEKQFPHFQWTDFVSVILTGWTEHFIELLENRVPKVELFFMDGPYRIIIEKRKNLWNLVFIDHAEAIYDEDVSPDFLNQYVSAVNSTLAHITSQGWVTKEIKKLTELNTKLRDLLEQQETEDSIDLTGRTFKLWDYSPSFQRMLIRSPQEPGIDFNIDIIFWGVEHIDIETYLGEITIHAQDTEDGKNKNITITSKDRTHHIVAHFYKIEKSFTDIFESPLDTI